MEDTRIDSSMSEDEIEEEEDDDDDDEEEEDIEEIEEVECSDDGNDALETLEETEKEEINHQELYKTFVNEINNKTKKEDNCKILTEKEKAYCNEVIKNKQLNKLNIKLRKELLYIQRKCQRIDNRFSKLKKLLQLLVYKYGRGHKDLQTLLKFKKDHLDLIDLPLSE